MNQCMQEIPFLVDRSLWFCFLLCCFLFQAHKLLKEKKQELPCLAALSASSTPASHSLLTSGSICTLALSYWAFP